MNSFAGRWYTSYGPMTLRQEGTTLTGSYGEGGTLEGTLEGERLHFRYSEPAEAGTGWFALERHGRFSGEYVPEGSSEAYGWEGHREFDGLWEGPFGELRLVQEPAYVSGRYGEAALEGTLDGGRLLFSYSEPGGTGSGWFALDESLAEFRGEWIADDESARGEWWGRRVLPLAEAAT